MNTLPGGPENEPSCNQSRICKGACDVSRLFPVKMTTDFGCKNLEGLELGHCDHRIADANGNCAQELGMLLTGLAKLHFWKES